MKKLLPRILLCLPGILVITQLTAQNKLNIAVDYLKNQKEQYLLKSKDVDDIRLIDQYTDEKNFLTHVNLIQYYKGVSVYNAIANVHVAANNQVLYATSRFVKDLEQKAINITPGITAGIAVTKALEHLNIPLTKALTELKNLVQQLKPNEHWFAKDEIALQDITSELMLLPVNADKQLQLVWKVNIYKKDAKEWWDVFVNAQTGVIITKNNFVISCSFAKPSETDNLSAENIPSTPFYVASANDFNVFSRPTEAPSFGSRTIVNSPWTLAGAAASPFGWLNDGTTNFTYTRGNNVFAYLDPTNINAAAALPANAANAGAGLDFNFPINFSQQPVTYANAAVTNLFYANNTMHDIWYRYGFTETARNFQKNNNGKGGSANDYVNAEAQDSRSNAPCVRDNANMATGADGVSPRMQMYLWSAGANAKINSPAGIAGNYIATSASTFGPCITNTNVTGNIVVAAAANGCDTFTNPVAIAGKIALIDRGTCTFIIKVKNAQIAGAIGVIVVNNIPGPPINMGGTDATINIPAIMLSQADGSIIKNALLSGAVNVTFNTSTPEIDGDLDNGIIFHEYGHGITHRLTGNGSTCNTNNERGDEGWSDWYALVLTQKPGDNAFTSRSIGTYVASQPATGPGIRSYPYSYNMTTNPHTYADIKNVTGAVHYIGEIWCSALWDMYWLMIDKYGYDPDIYNGTGGNNKTMQLVIDGLKLQACNPGFIDARNAILKADSINNGAANSCLIWNAFARRGMGFSATQGTSDTADETSATNLPPTCMNIVLPATLISLKAIGLKDKINIIWKTASEYNSDGFELQRKSALNEPFISLGNIASKSNNNGGADYSFDDVNVLPDVIYYYRLIQKDKDGKKSFSQVVTAIVRRQGQSKVIAYPNPVDKNMYLQFSTGFSPRVIIKINDAQGRVLYSKTFKEVSDTKVMLDISGYASGIYQITIFDENNKSVLKVIKK